MGETRITTLRDDSSGTELDLWTGSDGTLVLRSGHSAGYWTIPREIIRSVVAEDLRCARISDLLQMEDDELLGLSDAEA